uniref:Uncharacterized protein n=1 Tax=Anopheles christyi TaxID=43041 RepID=A0A182K4Q0_9DIPT
MAVTRSCSRLILCLAAFSIVGQLALAQEEEYEYYYEEVSASSTTSESTAPTETITEKVTPVTEIFTEDSTFNVIGSSNTETIVPVPITNEEQPPLVVPHMPDNSTTAVVESKLLSGNDDRRTNLSLLNTTRHSVVPAGGAKQAPRPGIVLNIYTGMYGMHSQGTNRPKGNLGGRNNFWTRNQSPLQGWYDLNGMANRRPMQSFVPRVQRRPVYRGRGPVYDYDDGYYPMTNQRPTKPRRNNQQSRGSTLEEQASMAVFNFLLQTLGQRGATGRSQPQQQSGTRRRV